MKNLKTILHSLLLSTFLLQASSSIASSSNEVIENTGTITFTFDDYESSCRVDDKAQMFEVSYYAGGPAIRPCPPNKISYIKLDGVRSAATIRLWSYLRSGQPGGCQFDQTHNFTLFFRTLKNTTTTQNIRLDDLFDISEGTVLQPGIQLIKKDITNKDKVNKLISCVQIIYD